MMTFEELQEHIHKLKQENPIWFDLVSDFRPSLNEISEFEARFHTKLPSVFTNFMMNFGGGYFAFSIIYSLERASDWNIEKANRDSCFKDYLIFSENSVGDFYGFLISDGTCSNEIYFYDHETNEWQKSHTDFADFICNHALRS